MAHIVTNLTILGHFPGHSRPCSSIHSTCRHMFYFPWGRQRLWSHVTWLLVGTGNGLWMGVITAQWNSWSKLPVSKTISTQSQWHAFLLWWIGRVVIAQMGVWLTRAMLELHIGISELFNLATGWHVHCRRWLLPDVWSHACPWLHD